MHPILGNLLFNYQELQTNSNTTRELQKHVGVSEFCAIFDGFSSLLSHLPW